MAEIQSFLILSRSGDGGGTGEGREGDEAAGSVENKDHLSPQLKLQLGLG